MDYIEHSVVKTIAAFLNTHPGGTLLIGVEEDENQRGIIRGNEEDGFSSDDKCERHVINIVGRDIGDLWAVATSPKVVRIDGKRILKIKVDRSPLPAWYMKDGERKFYVRQGPSTKALSKEDADEYINAYF